MKLLKIFGLAKAAGMDQIPQNFLKETACVLAYHCLKLTNLSVKLSVFPEECNISRLKPLFKKAQKPISKTTDLFHFCISCPKLLRNKYISNYKTILRMAYSSNIRQALKQFFNWFMSGTIKRFFLTGMVQGRHTGMILIDLQKVFGTLDHKVILEKIICFGFKISVIKGF